jgi:hypothetical protein
MEGLLSILIFEARITLTPKTVKDMTETENDP